MPAPEPVFSTPLEVVWSLYKLTLLNASVAPDTKPISGEPKIFLTLTKLPTSNLVVKLFCVSKLLALLISTKDVPIVSI